MHVYVYVRILVSMRIYEHMCLSSWIPCECLFCE